MSGPTIFTCGLCRETGTFTLTLVERFTWACPACVEKRDAEARGWESFNSFHSRQWHRRLREVA